MRHFLSIIIALAICIAGTKVVIACDEKIAQPLNFVSLWNNEAAAKLDNLNQIDALCKSENHSAACLEKNLSTASKVLPLYNSPEDPQPFGAFLIRFTPGESGSAAYVPLKNGGGPIFPVTLDMFDSDWGYGPPYFHQTMLDSKNGWYRIAVPNASVETGWVKLTNPHILTYQKGDIVSFKDKTYTILEVKKDSVSVRDEQPADMWCDAGNPPAIKKFEPITIPMKNLYDEGCHLLMKTTYTRGC